MLLTHRHADHANGAQRFRQISGAPVRAFEKQYCIAADELEDGEIISIEGLTPTIEVVHTPGHTRDCVSFFIHSNGGQDDSDVEAILTGDTIAPSHHHDFGNRWRPWGILGDLGQAQGARKERSTIARSRPDQPDVSEVAERYIERRELRLQQVKDALQELGEDANVGDIVDHIYTDVGPVLRNAAAQSTRVTLRFLKGE